MKLKNDRLEKILRQPEGKLPKGLHARTLRRLRLKPAPTVWLTRPLVWGPALASALALIWILRPSQGPSNAPLAPTGVTTEARSEELAYSRQHPGMPGPTTSMQVMQARALMQVEKEHEESLHQDLASAVGVMPQPTAVVTIALNDLSREKLAAPGSGVDATLSGWDINAARSEAGKDQAPRSYSLTVKSNRIRPAQNERVRLELRSPDPGPVRIRLFDAQSRQLRVMADLNSPSGPIIVEWDGRLENGQEAPSGAYTIIVESPKKTEKVAVLVVR